MKAAQVRRRILDEHTELRGMLDELEVLVGRFEEGAESGALLREKGLALYERFAAHLELEDEVLVPALRAVEPAGRERARELEDDHEEQRELLEYLMGRLEGKTHPSLLIARELRSFIDYVRSDMAHEEENMLARDVLRDETGGEPG